MQRLDESGVFEASRQLVTMMMSGIKSGETCECDDAKALRRKPRHDAAHVVRRSRER